MGQDDTNLTVTFNSITPNFTENATSDGKGIDYSFDPTQSVLNAPGDPQNTSGKSYTVSANALPSARGQENHITAGQSFSRSLTVVASPATLNIALSPISFNLAGYGSGAQPQSTPLATASITRSDGLPLAVTDLVGAGASMTGGTASAASLIAGSSGNVLTTQISSNSGSVPAANWNLSSLPQLFATATAVSGSTTANIGSVSEEAISTTIPSVLLAPLTLSPTTLPLAAPSITPSASPVPHGGFITVAPILSAYDPANPANTVAVSSGPSWTLNVLINGTSSGSVTPVIDSGSTVGLFGSTPSPLILGAIGTATQTNSITLTRHY